MPSLRLVFLFLLLPLCGSTQHYINGRVLDRATRNPLAFVNVVSTDGKYATSTDIEGKFILRSTQALSHIKLSYIGYESLTVPVAAGGGDPLLIYLEKSRIELNELVIDAGINPADLLMEKVIAGRTRNNPESATAFKYHNYNKLIVTLVPDSIMQRRAENPEQLDSNTRELFNFFDRQHLFMAESVTERVYFSASQQRETVLASKVSGFQSPIFNILATELQSFTFYRDRISLGGVEYEGPIAKNSTKNYFFHIEDTLYQEKDTVFIVSFRPKKGKNFTGLKGTLSIHSNGYALETVIAEPAEEKADGLGIKIQQKYALIEDRQWFPVQLNTTFFFRMLETGNFQPTGFANGYIKDIDLQPDRKGQRFGSITLKMAEDAGRKTDVYWDRFRNDTLDPKERETYRVIDSVGTAIKLERKMFAVTQLLEGRWALGPVSLDLDRLVRFNNYEGFRLGLGMHTNERVSRHISVGGYGAYGIRDKAFKYGGDLMLKFNPRRDAGIFFSYTHDLEETGGIDFFHVHYRSPLEYDYSSLFLNRFDKLQKGEAQVFFRALRHFKFYVSGNLQYRQSTEGYTFALPVNDQVSWLSSDFYIAEAATGFRFQYGETFIETPDRLVSKGSPFPVLWFKYSRGLTQVWRGELNYEKLELRLEKRHSLHRWGFFNYRLDAGLIQGEAPYGLLFNPRGTFKPFGLYTGNLEVLRTNEFLADRYAVLYLRHEIGSPFPKTSKFRPVLGWGTHIAIGTLSNPERHQGLEFTVPDKGYYESGILLNNLIVSKFSALGISAFYRYGPYQLPEARDNWAFKITAGFMIP